MSLFQQSQQWFPTHVQVTVLQAKDLKTKGKADTNDAYAIMQLGKEKYSTSVAEKSVSPVWREEASFELPLLHHGNRERCKLYVIVMHRALLGLDKFLGQAVINLWDLYESKDRRKTEWFKLQSKPGKKEKKRGQIEVDIQFMRNNMTASMFDLSMKEKSRSPFGKLKDKMKRKKDGLPDTASAIVPSATQVMTDSDEEEPKAEKKKSKIKSLFSKPGLKRTSISQSLSVLPTVQPIVSLSEKNKTRLGSASSEKMPKKIEEKPSLFPKIMTHKRTISADTKLTFGANKKEGLSLFSGLRSKNDLVTKSNLCINGSHVYVEENEPKDELPPKEENLTRSLQDLSSSHIYSSVEDLSSKTSAEPKNVASQPPATESLSRSPSSDSFKAMALPSYKAVSSTEWQGSHSQSNPKVLQESKKQETRRSSLLSLVTGKKDQAKKSEAGGTTEEPLEKEGTLTEMSEKKPELEKGPDVSNKKNSLNPFESDPEEGEISKSKNSLNPFETSREEETQKTNLPPRSTWIPKTSVVKPRLDMSSEAETKAKLSSSADNSSILLSPLSDSEPFLSAPEFIKSKSQDFDSFESLHSSFCPPAASLSNSSLQSLHSSSDHLNDTKAVEFHARKASICLDSPNEQLELSENRSFTSESHTTKSVQNVSPIHVKSTSNQKSAKYLFEELKSKKFSHTDEYLSTEQPEGLESFHCVEVHSEDQVCASPKEKSSEWSSSSVSTHYVSSEDPSPNAFGSAESVENANSFQDIVTFEHNEDTCILKNDESLAERGNNKNLNCSSETSLLDLIPEDKGHEVISNESLPTTAFKGKDEERASLDFENIDTSHIKVQSSLNLSPSELPVISEKPEWILEDEEFAPLYGREKRAAKHEQSFSNVAKDLKTSLDIGITFTENRIISPVKGEINLNPEVNQEDSVNHMHSHKAVENKDLNMAEVGKQSLKIKESADFGKGTLELSSIQKEQTLQMIDKGKQSPERNELTDFGNARILEVSKMKGNDDQEVIVEGRDSPKKNGEPLKRNESVGKERTLEVSKSPSLSDSSLSNMLEFSDYVLCPPSDAYMANSKESMKKPVGENFESENSGKKKVLQAWVSPSGTQQIKSQQNDVPMSARCRLHPVKPMNQSESKAPLTSSEVSTSVSQGYINNKAFLKNYDPSDPAYAYAQLTHEELIKLVLKQKDTIAKKESEVRDLEDYIDNLIVQVMEEAPSILSISRNVAKKAEQV
uniref:Rab11 family-interacting protein 2 n=1 Tax=Latimeria chalumnae TaxID=7897 RepID=H3B0K0_LATCH